MHTGFRVNSRVTAPGNGSLLLDKDGGNMFNLSIVRRGLPALMFLLFALPAAAQSFRVQCPTQTALHPLANASGQVSTDPGAVGPFNSPNPHIKCQQLSGGDGFASMGDGTQTYLFSFGPLSGLKNIVNGLPGTTTAAEFNQSNLDASGKVLDVIKIGAPDGPGYPFNGAIGIVPDGGEQVGSVGFVIDPLTDLPIIGTGYKAGDKLTFSGGGPGVSVATAHVATVGAGGGITSIVIDSPGFNYSLAPTVTITSANGRSAQPVANLIASSEIDGHVDPRLIMDVGVLNGNIPAPMIAIDEGDELFLTLTNVGMIMRPDLFEQHTVHFHGYPNASAFYDGVPDASVAISIGGSFTYYYLAPEAGTYMWHCHISPPEHLQMGMVGQLYVRPRQNTVKSGDSLYAAAQAAQNDLTTKCSSTDILCSTQVPKTTGVNSDGRMSAYNDGDGSTAYDVEYPIQLMGFDPNFHFVGMTFNPESFADNKDKYFLVNGRSYPDTINPAPLSTQATDGTPHFSQPLPTIVNIPCIKTNTSDATCADGRALLRISDLNVTEYHTFASLGIPMHVVGYNARLLRDQDGNNTDYLSNSVSLAGGESADVILSASGLAANQTFYLYTPQFDHLSNDAENFGGMMTEVHVCPGAVNAATKACN
jgi:FtsP/CotA-like multicopper oxidase with cupredoxin domain